MLLFPSQQATMRATSSGDNSSSNGSGVTYGASVSAAPVAVETLTATEANTRVAVVVLMDEAEERRPSKVRVSSIPILRQLELPRCSIHPVRADRPTAPALLQQWADLSSPHTALLYPSESSRTLDLSYSTRDKHQCQQDEEEQPRIDTLVVLDGSWRTVQQILYHNPLLQPRKLRHVRLDVAATYTSYYQRCGLRQEPAPNCVSTAEAIALALVCLEAPTNIVGRLILNSFKKFVENNSDYIEDLSQQSNLSVIDGDKSSSILVKRSVANGSDDNKETESNNFIGSSQSCGTKRKINCSALNDDVTIATYNGEINCDDGDVRHDEEGAESCLLFRSKGVMGKSSLTKSQKRKVNRKKEKKRKR